MKRQKSNYFAWKIGRDLLGNAQVLCGNLFLHILSLKFKILNLVYFMCTYLKIFLSQGCGAAQGILNL